MGARSQRGQTAVEYLGILLAVAAILAVLLTAAPGIGVAVAERIGCVIQFSDCATPGPAAAPALTPEQIRAQRIELLDRYQAVSLQEFLDEKRSPGRDERMDWSDDGCSAPVVGSTGASFDFTAACERHDYGYRNSKDLDVFADRKAAIDARFYEDMRDHCATRSVLLRGSCYRWAATFYAGVRAFG